MNDLIWIGNTLYPRWFVFAVIALVVFAIAGVVIRASQNNRSKFND